MAKPYVMGDTALSAVLLSRCQAALGGSYKVVTFRAAGPLTATEELLGRALVEECRQALAATWKVRMSLDIYIPGKRKGGRPSKDVDRVIAWLCGGRGYSARAVADVLGLSESMVTSRCAGLGVVAIAGGAKLDDSAEAVERGLTVLRRRYRAAWGDFRTVPELAAAIGDVDMADLWLRVLETGNAAKEVQR